MGDLDKLSLGQMQSMLASLVESSDDAIISKNLQSIVQTWNRGAERLFGYSAEEMIGQSITKLIPDELLKEEDEILSKLKRGETIEHYETLRKCKDGQLVSISLTVSPVYDESGSLVGGSKIARNITNQQKMNRERAVLQNTLSGVEETSKLKSDFISTLSHEIRAPLGGIVSLAEILSTEEELPESSKGVADAILDASRSLFSVLNELLDFSKVEAGKVHLENRMFSLRATIVDVIRIINPSRTKKGLLLRSIVDPDIPEFISGDELRVRQVLLNLATNAVKFSHEGAVYISANLVETKDDSLIIEFKVSDTGIGLSEDTIERLFQPYVQADPSTSRVFGGTGLGLSIAKSYVDLMGGEIGVQSRPKEGSTFWFRVPFLRENIIAKQPISSETEAEA